MEVVCEARQLPLLLGAPPALVRPSLFFLRKSHFPLLFHEMPWRNAFRGYPQARIFSCCPKSALPSVGKSDMNATPRKLRKVLWCIEADLPDGQQLYLTGDPLALGCWVPEVAVPMLPSPKESNLWTTEIKVPCGMNFKYNYFVKEGKLSSSSVNWREGPDFSISIPVRCRKKERVIVRDSWMMEKVLINPVSSWGSWLFDIDIFPSQSEKHLGHEVSFSGESEDLKIQNVDSSRLKLLDATLLFKDELNALGNGTANVVNDFGSDLCSSVLESDQPCEEPWLLHSLGSNLVTIQVDETSTTFPNMRFFATNKVEPEEESEPSVSKKPVSTTILINSSVCTMQRIAVLEDGKLVELLLEPVKHIVQCDSVYLGVVTKLVPHMGGAFVDIGISRPSLMDIKPNREPFAYPPFSSKVKKRKSDASIVSETKDHVEPILHGEDDVVLDFLQADLQDDTEQFVHEDLEDHEPAINLESFDTPKGQADGGTVDYDGGETDFEDYFEESGHSIDGENADEFLPLEMESSNDADQSCHMVEDLKVPDETYSVVNKWALVKKGTKVIVQVVKEGLGTKGPALSPYPSLKSRFWVLSTRCDRIGVSKKITGVERTRLKVIAKTLQPPGFGLTVRTVAANHPVEELQKDLEGLFSTWKDIVEHAKSAALAADEGVAGAVPVILHRAMGQTLSVVQDYFNEKVETMVVDSHRTYHEVTSYLQEIAPDLCNRVKLYDKRVPIFDKYGIEEEINNILSKRVLLSNGGSLVIEQTEALVSIDVNGGHGMLGQKTSQEKAILDVNLTAAKQIARELRLRDIGGIIVVDFIDMIDDAHKRLVYEEIKKAVERDRSMVKVSELSKHGLMEITRKRVRPSVTFMISEPCTCCHATGRVESLETTFSKIEHEICRLLAVSNQKSSPDHAKSWPKFVLRVDHYMCNYLTSGKRTKLAVLSSSLKVWILLKVARGFARGFFEMKPFAEEKVESDKKQVAISRLKSSENGSYIPSGKLTLFPVKKWRTSRK